MIKAVIFDMDGVLIDSEQIWDEAEKTVFSSYGISVTETDQILTRHMNMQEVSAYWSKKSQQPFSAADSEQRVIEEVCQQIHARPKAMQGVVDLLEQLSQANLPMGLATNAPKQVCQTVLQCLQIETFFSAVHTADDVTQTKPHPEIYLKSAERLQVLPQHCLVFEDSPTGVRAAHAAGMQVIYVNPQRLADTPTLNLIRLALHSLENFSLPDHLTVHFCQP